MRRRGAPTPRDAHFSFPAATVTTRQHAAVVIDICPVEIRKSSTTSFQYRTPAARKAHARLSFMHWALCRNRRGESAADPTTPSTTLSKLEFTGAI
jgi:hypothetical protein